MTEEMKKFSRVWAVIALSLLLTALIGAFYPMVMLVFIGLMMAVALSLSLAVVTHEVSRIYRGEGK